MPKPQVTIVVPHYRPGMLELLLESLGSKKCEVSFSLILVDDRPRKTPLTTLREKYPWMEIESSGSKSGYGASCNRGAKLAKAKYLLFLNDDVEVTAGWLDSLLVAYEAEDSIGACVPKILCGRKRSQFDHSGAAGGEMDRFGYPFARGRLFGVREVDSGQYDFARDIVWGSGAALLIRRDRFLALGGFDESYHMQMEDIDLCWRLQQEGFRIRYVAESAVYHVNGWSLARGSFRKQYLNHCNNLTFLLKNWTWRELAVALPGRGVLELCGLLYTLTHWRRLPQGGAILCAWAAAVWSLPRVMAGRTKQLPKHRACGAQLYGGSVAIEHFIFQRQTTRELKHL